jgi:UDP-glucose 4-epimerase
MAVYGEPPEASVSERVPPAPVSNYGVSKLCGEYYIRSQEPRGLGFTILRMFNVYGPGQDLSNVKHGMAGIFLGYVLRNVPVPVTGSLERFRDFVYIDDVLRAWLLALDAPEAIGKTYNVGSGNKTTVRELLDAIIRSCGHDPATYPVLLVTNMGSLRIQVVSRLTSAGTLRSRLNGA